MTNLLGKHLIVTCALGIMAGGCFSAEDAPGDSSDTFLDQDVANTDSDHQGIELDDGDREKLGDRVLIESDTGVDGNYRVGGSGADGFTFRDSFESNGPRFFWMDISKTGTKLSLGDDAGANIALPFSFPFYGTNYTNIGVSSNGGLHFDGSYLHYINSAIPGVTQNGVIRYIAAYWDDLNPTTGGGVYHQIRGASPNRKLVVQWDQIGHYGNAGDKITVQAVLFEGSGNVLLQYYDPSLEGGIGATVGVQGSTTQGLQYVFNTTDLKGGLAVCFTPTGGNFDNCRLNGPDGNGYTFTDSDQPGSPQFYWKEISETGTNLGLGDDTSAAADIGFTFPFYGSNYTSLRVGSNGALVFGSTATMSYANTTIPASNSTGAQRHISLYWDDLRPGAGSAVYTKIEGSSPNRRLIVQWNSVPHYDGADDERVTAQAILFETTGNILLQYLNPSYRKGSSATVGIQKSNTEGLLYSYNEGVLGDRSAVCFIPAGQSSAGCTMANYLTRKGEVTVTETQQYYAQINAPTTFAAWKSQFGFGSSSGVITAKYYNNFDLGLGRDMRCRKNGLDVACYVTNYGIAPGGPANTALNHVLAGIDPLATVAMVYVNASNGGANDVRYYVYDGAGNRIDQVALDSEGAKSIPNVCLSCHGGTYNTSTNSVTGSSFLPFDVFTYVFSTADANFSLANQQEAFRQLNVMVKDTNPSTAIVDLINGTYAASGGVGTPGATASDAYVPAGWAGQEDVYHKVVKTSCRGCHMAQSLDFTQSSHLTSAQYSTCNSKQMPHAEKPYKNFWTTDGPHLPTYLSAAMGFTQCLDPTPFTTAGTPIPASFKRITASSVGELINSMFRTTSPNPEAPFGTFNASTDTVTATADSGYFKILLNLGPYAGLYYQVSNTIVGESDIALSQWNWYRDACCLAGTRSVWTSNGWASIDTVGMGAAVAHNGKYYYRIELADVHMADYLGTFIASEGSATTVRFYSY